MAETVKGWPGPGHAASPVTLAGAFRQWRLPPLPAGEAPGPLAVLGRRARGRLARAGSPRARARLELRLADWAWRAVKMNVRRGRLFELPRALAAGEADCLGYASTLQGLGRRLGLDMGIAEVLVDNAGRAVPHVVNLLRLADGRVRFMDLWYGSRNIRHRRLGLMVRRGGRWRVADVNRRDLRRWEEFRGLPPRCVEAISGYMMGNRHLERGLQVDPGGLRDAGRRTELEEAERCYTVATRLCPENSRIRFNRAVARENLGNRRGAEADYAAALGDEAGLIRVQARLPDEVVALVGLDRLGITPLEEEAYLLSAGFTTGREVPVERIAAGLRVPVDEVERMVSRVRGGLAAAPGWPGPGDAQQPVRPKARRPS